MWVRSCLSHFITVTILGTFHLDILTSGVTNLTCPQLSSRSTPNAHLFFAQLPTSQETAAPSLQLLRPVLGPCKYVSYRCCRERRGYALVSLPVIQSWPPNRFIPPIFLPKPQQSLTNPVSLAFHTQPESNHFSSPPPNRPNPSHILTHLDCCNDLLSGLPTCTLAPGVSSPPNNQITTFLYLKFSNGFQSAQNKSQRKSFQPVPVASLSTSAPGALIS